MHINQKRRIAVSALFFLSGLCFSSWASRIPDIQRKLGLDEGELGFLLLAMPVGSLIAMPLIGWLVDHFGNRNVVIIGGVLYPLALPLVGLSPNFWILAIGLMLFGMCGNLLNISMNAQSIGVEKLYGRTIIASFHGLWSLAGFVGGSIGALMISQQLTPPVHFAVITLIGFLIILLAFRYTIHQPGQPTSGKPSLRKMDPQLLRIGLISMCGMMCEGCMFDWSGVYFEKVVLAEKALITAGYIAFMSTMALGRFVADYFTNRFGITRMLQMSSALICTGLLIAVIFPYLTPAILGFILVGFGVSSVVPLAYSVAGKSGKSPGTALAMVSTIGYAGFLLGPPLIGFLADAFNLRVSFTLIACIGVMVGVLATIDASVRARPQLNVR